MIGSLALLVCMFALFCFSGCDILGGKGKIDANDYVGSYQSTFVDSQKAGDSITFSLEIKQDGAFLLNGNDRNYKGTWKSYTQDGKTQILCLVENYKWNDNYPDAWNPYFTICILDDGTLMATPAMTSSSYSSTSAFGYGDITMITLVLFEKL